jgi:hypothetical protein
MSSVTTQPEMLAWATENLQGVQRHAPTAILKATRPANQPVSGQRISQLRRGRHTTDRILTTSQLVRHSASPRRLPIGEMHKGDTCNFRSLSSNLTGQTDVPDPMCLESL